MAQRAKKLATQSLGPDCESSELTEKANVAGVSVVLALWDFPGKDG